MGTFIDIESAFISIKGVLHLLPQKASKLACFVLYLKIINIFSKNNLWILQKIVQGSQK